VSKLLGLSAPLAWGLVLAALAFGLTEDGEDGERVRGRQQANGFATRHRYEIAALSACAAWLAVPMWDFPTAAVFAAGVFVFVASLMRWIGWFRAGSLSS